MLRCFATKIIGLVGFEPTASWSRTRRSTKLSHSPNCSSDLARQGGARPYFAYFATPSKRFNFPWISKFVKRDTIRPRVPKENYFPGAHALLPQLALSYRASKIGRCFLNPILL